MDIQPNIGIWWDNGDTIISFKQRPQQPEQYTGLCDSEYSHNDLWPDAALPLGVGPDTEYFSVARGRVLWNPKKKEAIIYHGNATTQDRQEKIAEEFGLTKWISKRDIHYASGSEADALFSDDES